MYKYAYYFNIFAINILHHQQQQHQQHHYLELLFLSFSMCRTAKSYFTDLRDAGKTSLSLTVWVFYFLSSTSFWAKMSFSIYLHALLCCSGDTRSATTESFGNWATLTHCWSWSQRTVANLSFTGIPRGSCHSNTNPSRHRNATFDVFNRESKG